jgi:tetratricopeptide (TPR) repeat protein
MHQEVCVKVYRDRILRGAGNDGFYSVKKLGAFGADLGAVACFFESPWRRVSPDLTAPAQAWLLNEAGFRLRALGRLAEAREPMQAALDMRVAQENLREAASAATNLVELELTLGDVGAAIGDGERAVAHADKSGDAGMQLANRTALGDALHHAGQRAEAEERFGKAEAMAAEQLYSLWGFRYCDLLLSGPERATWRRLFEEPKGASHVEPDTAKAPPNGAGAQESILEDTSDDSERLRQACQSVSQRAAKSLPVSERYKDLLSIGLDHLTLARAALYKSILGGELRTRAHPNEAVDYLRRAGQQDYLHRALLTRAMWRAVSGDFDGARDDLDEAFEIAERGPMRLILADIHLHRARLFGLMANRPAAYPWVSARDDLDKARKLIDECGYGRRREELEDAEAAWERLYGPAAPGGAA